MSTRRIWLVDGIKKIGAEDAAIAAGSTKGSFTNTAFLNEKEHGKGCVFMLRGHTIQGKCRTTELPEQSESDAVPVESEQRSFALTCNSITNPKPEDIPSSQELLATELRGVKEELRYLRECLVGRFHGLDEIAEHVRSIEMRVIESKKVHGSYHGGIGNVTERIG